MATTEPFIIGKGNGSLNRHDKVWQSKLSSTMIPGREILRGGGMRSRRIRLFPWPMVRHARSNDPHEDAERAYPGKHLCEAVCGTICGWGGDLHRDRQRNLNWRRRLSAGRADEQRNYNCERRGLASARIPEEGNRAG